jgi:uncharacterized protein YutE (UPF0331/DUF86 family)
MKSLEMRHQTLLKIYVKIDELLEQIKAKAYRDADAWLKKFCPEVKQKSQELGDIHTCQKENHDATTCNEAVITNFQRCYTQTLHFLTSYLKEKHNISAHSPETVFKKCLQNKIISKAEAKKMIKMVDTIDALCHIYNQKGQHIISTDLVDYYNSMHTIIRRISLS